ncbi:hypothetical protein RHSIM_Rhsim04G0093300 [Rhododendron simsii]|uniref:Mediator of RNA polymerase II transcription subunit 7 n=1 Tax=Rhododendron simsii TaxID=118357 RepID=A0A834H0Y8_RHOSS|nr:hypothetical protein RHSIM_Rhsim04G0093300 [Rhododendron simsii]
MLNRELQLHILELADVPVELPSQYARRVEDISLIFKNLHHLLNSLRPHQGRATLIHLLESQIQHRKQAVEDIKRYGSGTLIEVFRVIEMKSLTSGYVAFENVLLTNKNNVATVLGGEKKRRNCLRRLLEHWMAISL